MGLFDRLSSLIKANLNDLISKAEEPEKLLEQSILDMRSQLAKAKQQVAAAIADEKRYMIRPIRNSSSRVSGSSARCWPSSRIATTSPVRH